MASNGTPQSTMYQMRGSTTSNYGRDRSAEQYHATNNGNPNMPYNYSPNDMYNQYFYGASNTPTGGQRSELSRYSPPMLNHFTSQWQQGPGAYSYNLPNNFGPYLGGYGSGNNAMSQYANMGSGMMPNFQGGPYGYPGGYGGVGSSQQQMQAYLPQISQQMQGNLPTNNPYPALGGTFGQHRAPMNVQPPMMPYLPQMSNAMPNITPVSQTNKGQAATAGFIPQMDTGPTSNPVPQGGFAQNYGFNPTGSGPPQQADWSGYPDSIKMLFTRMYAGGQ